MLINFFVLSIMFIGLFCTLTPRLPGTLIILGAAFFYTAIKGYATVEPWVAYSLMLLVILAEVGGRLARIYWTKGYRIPMEFSSDATAGSIAGVIASDALFGPILGTVVWELIVGKTFVPRWDTISQVLKRLVIVALLRYLCGVVMVLLIIKYILI